MSLTRIVEWANSLLGRYGRNNIQGNPQLDIMNITEKEVVSKCAKSCKIRKDYSLKDFEVSC